jgi:hypothetical protein
MTNERLHKARAQKQHQSEKHPEHGEMHIDLHATFR